MLDAAELKKRYNEAIKWDDYANKLKLLGSLAILFLAIFFLKATGILENSGPALVYVLVTACVLMIVWRVWIARYCKKRKDSILSPEEQNVAKQLLHRELADVLSGKNRKG